MEYLGLLGGIRSRVLHILYSKRSFPSLSILCGDVLNEEYFHRWDYIQIIRRFVNSFPSSIVMIASEPSIMARLRAKPCWSLSKLCGDGELTTMYYRTELTAHSKAGWLAHGLHGCDICIFWPDSFHYFSRFSYHHRKLVLQSNGSKVEMSDLRVDLICSFNTARQIL